MELPTIKNRVLSVRVQQVNKEQYTSHSINLVNKNDLSIEIYRLKGNEKLEYLQQYQLLMKKYMRSISGNNLIKNARKEINQRKLLKGFNTPSRIFTDVRIPYRLSSTPSNFL